MRTILASRSAISFLSGSRPRLPVFSQALTSRVSPPKPASCSLVLRSQFRAHPTVHLAQPRQAASSLWGIALVVGILGSTFLFIQSDNPPPSPPRSELNRSQTQDHDFLGPINTLKMSSNSIETGHVGNLTEEQEAKLREMWTVIFKLTGVKFEEGEIRGRATSVTSLNAPASPTDSKKKSKRGWFGLGGAKEEAPVVDSATAGLSVLNVSDADDKFGQVKEFKQALADLTPDQLRETLWSMVKADDPDALLLRFLRARKWDVGKAVVMLVSTIRWRLTEMHVDDDIMLGGEASAVTQSESKDSSKKRLGSDFMLQMRMGKSFVHGVDKQGRPICLIRVRMHKIGAQVGESVERLTVHMIETTRLMLPRPVETAVIIFDMTGFTLANMDYTPVKFIIKCFEANYPESLGAVLIHQAPWIFAGIWKVIKGWLDPVVAAKVHFTNSVEDLEVFIDRSRILKELGGDEEYNYEYIEQQPGENDALKDTLKRDELLAKNKALATEYQELTKAWIAAANKDKKEEAEAIKPKREELVDRIGKSYWELDPYIRARSFYDRAGVIKSGGVVDFYPERSALKENGTAEKKEVPVVNGNGTAHVTDEEKAPITVSAEAPAVAAASN
ncbi:hypothetical protein BGW36DRAFT_355844 [Talaromyces proteolyticus]|uniref:CRAL-TRIO domain-containing protein n=1 Tax=Talaromyces proteolyticus TaxID=1131652 RepID=A0AAD4KXM2_9EURO|nr:uncharacterized protein BGW36DRAFT_355844 [Talaromyces proteolyticus]KAH8701688.1 hypothetical protein BGW36DRAFT_355844 [Talaromyces proteolyticus]